MDKRIVVIGGVAGGASTAARLRRLSEDYQITLIERGEHISFANCGLPYYVGGVITDKKKLVLQTPERMSRRFNIDIRTNTEAVSIDRDKKQVTIVNVKDNTTEELPYDKLVLAPGAFPIVPGSTYANSSRVFTLRNIPDTYQICDFLSETKAKSAVVVGAGFIGLEMAENLLERGLEVHVVELADHVIGNIDADMAAILHTHLKDKGIKLHLKTCIENIEDHDNSTTATLSDGESIDTDVIILSIGVRPETKLAKDAGLKLGETGGIYVDAYMQTSDENIYAVGDAVEVLDFVSGKPALIPLAGPANKQGRIAANNIYGLKEAYTGTQGTAILKVFDLTVACCGNNERILKRNNTEYIKSYIHPDSHAGYYPGGNTMCIKLMFDRDGKILGATAVGVDGVDKRMDVLATAMRAGLTVHDLEKLELAYAPPFSSAKDPVNMAGYTASNILKDQVKIFHWHDIPDIDMSKAVLVDVRKKNEFDAGTIPGAIHIPLDDIRERLSEFPKDKDIYLFCRAGLRGYLASRILTLSGYTNHYNLSGGYLTYDYCTKGIE